MARASKRYNSLEAHEYYERYRKRGVKKGRSSTTDLLEDTKHSTNIKKKRAVVKLKTEMQKRVRTIRRRIKEAKESTGDVLTDDVVESFKTEIEDLRVEIKQKYNQIKKDYESAQDISKIKLNNRYELF